MIRAGLIAAAITQNLVGIGYKTVQAAVKALRGEQLSKHIDTGFSMATSAISPTR